MLCKPALQFRAAPTKANIPPETDMRDRVCSATTHVVAHPTRGENPAAGKLHAVDDFVVCPCWRIGTINLLALLPLTPHGFPFVPFSLELKKCIAQRYEAYHLDLRKPHPDCFDSEPSDPSLPSDVPLREEPEDEEENEERQ